MASEQAQRNRKLCIAVGPSNEAQAAFRWAKTKLLGPGDEVYLLSVVHSSVKSEGAGGSGSESGIVRSELVKCDPDPQQMAAIKQLLSSCKEELITQAGVSEGSVHMQPRVACVEGSHDVGRTLIRAADDCGCDAMVIGSRGLGLTRRAMLGLFGLGSVSSFVVNHAPMNVIVHKQTTATAASPKE